MNKTSYTKPQQNSNMHAPTHPYTHTHIYVKWHLLARWMKRWIRCIHISEARTNHVSSPSQYLDTIRGVKRLHRKCQTVQTLRIDCVTRSCETFRKDRERERKKTLGCLKLVLIFLMNINKTLQVLKTCDHKKCELSYNVSYYRAYI